MKKLLHSHTLLIALLVVTFSYFIDLINYEIIWNDSVWRQYVNEKYEKKYDEYKDLDIDLSEFAEEMKQIEESAAKEEAGYTLEDFYIDTLFVMVPLVVVVLGFSCILLLFFLFHKSLHLIRYLIILKATLLAYLIFWVPTIAANIYFTMVKKEYTVPNLKEFGSFFDLSHFIKEESVSSWVWDYIIVEIGLVYILFPLLTALLLKIYYKQFKFIQLLAYSLLALIVGFVFYSILLWYLLEL